MSNKQKDYEKNFKERFKRDLRIVRENEEKRTLKLVLKLIRLYHKFSQTDIAIGMNVSKSSISEAESEISQKDVSLNLLNKYAIYFNIALSNIFYLRECVIAGKELPLPSEVHKELLEWAME